MLLATEPTLQLQITFNTGPLRSPKEGGKVLLSVIHQDGGSSRKFHT